jgi:tetratricopeptide (TPR) repeat protein
MYKANPEKYRKYLYLLPVIEIIWVNMQPSFVIGVSLVTIFAVTDFLMTRKFSILQVIMLVMLPLMLVNPYGYKLLIEILKIRDPFFVQNFSELLSPFHPYFQDQPLLIFYKLALVLGIVSFAINGKKIDLTNLMLFVFGACLSMMGMRYMSEFSLVFLPVICLNLNHVPELKKPVLVNWLNACCCLITGILIFLVVTNDFGPYKTGNVRFGLGIRKNCYPDKAADFVIDQKISGNMFNEMNFGASLLWRFYPDRKVFIDARLVGYPRERFIESYRFYEQPADCLAEHKIDYCILDYPNENVKKMVLHEFLFKHRDLWKLVYWDDVALVYVKNNKQNKDLITKFEYRFINPVFIEYCFKKYAGKILAGELVKNLGRDPDCAKSHFYLGSVYFRQGKLRSSAEEYIKSIEIFPTYAPAYYNLGVLFSSVNDSETAVKYLKQGMNCSRPAYGKRFKALIDQINKG